MFLSLYGHSQPVLCLDISFDSRLVITGSSDRTIKIWGLDFGDCHRSLFAHDDTITAVQFVPKTHLFFSASKDNKVKYWDGDKFLHIQTLDVSEIVSLPCVAFSLIIQWCRDIVVKFVVCLSPAMACILPQPLTIERFVSGNAPKNLWFWKKKRNR